jgi:hypothetical protein
VESDEKNEEQYGAESKVFFTHSFYSILLSIPSSPFFPCSILSALHSTALHTPSLRTDWSRIEQYKQNEWIRMEQRAEEWSRKNGEQNEEQNRKDRTAQKSYDAPTSYQKRFRCVRLEVDLVGYY